VRIDELQFELPTELIAQRPVEPRDASRLLVLTRPAGQVEHRRFRDIRQYLRPGDCLILNDTRVIPARFFCQRATGGQVEALFLHQTGGPCFVASRQAVVNLNLHNKLPFDWFNKIKKPGNVSRAP